MNRPDIWSSLPLAVREAYYTNPIVNRAVQHFANSSKPVSELPWFLVEVLILANAALIETEIQRASMAPLSPQK